MSMTVAELARRIGAEVRGDGACTVTRCGGLEDADEQTVSFLANRRYVKRLKDTRAGAVVLSPEDAERATGRTVLVSERPYFAFREAVVALHGFREQPRPGISDLAVIHDTAMFGADCCVQPFAVIEAGVTLGDNCIIYPHCVIGPNVRVGDDCIFYPGVVIYDDCVIGDRVTIHANSVIGEDGFGYATDKGVHHKIPQVGNVVIEDDVEIGAGCAIDRATLGSTVIGRGTKFSNLIAIGHGTKVGPHNLFVAQVGIAGSSKTGSHVALGGQTGVVGHITIGDRAQIAAKTGVLQNIPADQQWGGYAAMPLDDMKKVAWEVIHLPALVQEFNTLKARVAELEAVRKSETK